MCCLLGFAFAGLGIASDSQYETKVTDVQGLGKWIFTASHRFTHSPSHPLIVSCRTRHHALAEILLFAAGGGAVGFGGGGLFAAVRKRNPPRMSGRRDCAGLVNQANWPSLFPVPGSRAAGHRESYSR